MLGCRLDAQCSPQRASTFDLRLWRLWRHPCGRFLLVNFQSIFFFFFFLLLLKQGSATGPIVLPLHNPILSLSALDAKPKNTITAIVRVQHRSIIDNSVGQYLHVFMNYVPNRVRQPTNHLWRIKSAQILKKLKKKKKKLQEMYLTNHLKKKTIKFFFLSYLISNETNRGRHWLSRSSSLSLANPLTRASHTHTHTHTHTLTH